MYILILSFFLGLQTVFAQACGGCGSLSNWVFHGCGPDSSIACSCDSFGYWNIRQDCSATGQICGAGACVDKPTPTPVACLRGNTTCWALGGSNSCSTCCSGASYDETGALGLVVRSKCVAVPTSTPMPTATNTPRPTATATIRPTTTPIPTLKPTNIPQPPTPIPTLRPTVTSSPRPTAITIPTSTPKPCICENSGDYCPTYRYFDTCGRPICSGTKVCVTPTLIPTLTRVPIVTPSLRPTLTPSPTPTPSATPTPTSIFTPTPTATPIPTETPTITPIPLPTLTLVPIPTTQALAPPVVGTPRDNWSCNGSSEYVDTALGCVPVDFYKFINYLYPFLISMCGGILFLRLAWAFVGISRAAGDAKLISDMKDVIFSDLKGGILVIFSIFILRLILVGIFKIPGIE